MANNQFDNARDFGFDMVYMDEAQQLCGRIAMINKGKVERLDTPEAFIKELGEYAIDVFGEEHTESRFFATQQQALDYAGTLSRRFMLRATTLEDVFLSIVGRGLTDK